jgi:tRNA G18 (ribose-2'-O)-methylase SpoU
MRWSSRPSPTTHRSSPGDVGVTVTINDASDARLDDYRSLNDQAFRRRYEADECFIAEGYVAIDRLIESGHTVRSVLLAPSRTERFAEHAEALMAAHVPLYVAERGVIADVVGFDLHRGVIACAQRRPHPSIEELVVGAHRLAVLEGLNDAENLGAISRAARAFGIDGLVIDHRCTDPYSRRTVRVSMGEVLTLPIARASAEEWADVPGRLASAGFEVWAMTPAGDDDLWRVSAPARLAVCLGAEGPGLTRTVLENATRRVRIPISPGVDSLNVAQAAAVTFAGVTRPR